MLHERLNVLNRTDSYKISHFMQYPPESEYVRSYIESRGGQFDEVVFFGLQAYIKEKLLKPFTAADVARMKRKATAHGEPFNEEGWTRILTEFGGLLPLEIEALPEGTVTAPRVPQVQVINTVKGFGWLTSYVETDMLRGVWYPSTVASLSRYIKGLIKAGLERTADNTDGLMFKLHDFGARGASSSETAALGGMAHLVNFMGTDTFEALEAAEVYYGAEMAGFSIPATEHSTVTSWGREGELDCYANLLKVYHDKMFSCVSDSYDIMNATTEMWGGALREQVLARDPSTPLVIRPDSGDEVQTPLDVIEAAMDKFGFTVNSKGFRLLPPQVRVIQGDGMGVQTIPKLINNAIARKISVDNFAMGMGGGLLQNVHRDTCRYAMKANEACIGGVWRDVFKDPITDKGKQSKKGRQAVISVDGKLTSVPYAQLFAQGHAPAHNHLRPVYRNGKLLVDDTFDVVRERAAL